MTFLFITLPWIKHGMKANKVQGYFFYSSLGFCIMKSHRSALGSEGYIVNVQRFELREKNSYQISHRYCTKHFCNNKNMDTIKYLNPHLLPTFTHRVSVSWSTGSMANGLSWEKNSYQISHLYCTKHFSNNKNMHTIKYLHPQLLPAGGTGLLYSPARRRSLRTLISLSSAGVRIWQMQTMSDSLIARTH